jgi:hypothetical protein
MSAALPWDVNPALKLERLVTLARLVAETRNKVFAAADREEGDTNWGLGCRAHERLGHALARLADAGKHPWLTVTREGLYLMPLIDGIPVRPYRGAPTKPGSRHLDAVRAEAERSQPKQTAFSFMDGLEQDGPWHWLMALETDATFKVVRVVYLQANEAGVTRHHWECPLDAKLEEPAPERKRVPPPKSAPRATSRAAVAAADALVLPMALPLAAEGSVAMNVG